MTVTESLETRLRHHLTADMYPPIRPENISLMIGYCKQAIRGAALGLWDDVIQFPAGERTVRQMVEDLRLEFFVDEMSPRGRAPDRSD